MDLETSAIQRVTFYTASPIECCDRCSQGIKYVYLVSYRDGLTQKYGSECINRILDAEPTMLSLFNKNAKLLRKYQEYLRILSGPEADMPRGHEYYGSGMYFVADSKGVDIMFGHYFFHPVFDQDKNAAGTQYVQTDPIATQAKNRAAIQAGLPKLQAEINRLETFLAKVLRSAKIKLP